MSVPGEHMAAEVAEQPAVYDRILTTGLPAIRQVAEEISARGPRFVALTARGTSDNAAYYAKYLIEVLLGLPVGLTSMSTRTLYEAELNYADVLCVTVSQSGGSDDLLQFTEAARKGGAITLAVTNAADSPVNNASEFSLDVLAGKEIAQPATKSYTAELLTLYLLVDALRKGDASDAKDLPALAAGLLDRHDEITALAQRYRFTTNLMIVSRGYSAATAHEAAWKIMETSYLQAHAYSSADLMHGPIALVDSMSPVIALAPEGVTGTAMHDTIDRLRERDADLTVVGTQELVETAARGFSLPAGVSEQVSPMLEILPFQWLAYEISMQRGLNPDAPRALAKVTSTR
jgi:glucosamine--fructose-6-phosphate aminotransferase (isomerizing)